MHVFVNATYIADLLLSPSTPLLGTLRYPGRGLGGRQPEVNSQGLEFNLHKCHATRRPPRQLRRRLSSFWRPLRKVS